MKVVQVNFAFDRRISTPDALLDRYWTLTGWSDALLAAGAEVRAVQRSTRDEVRTRGGAQYVFCSNDRRLSEAAAAFAPDVVHVNGAEFPFRTWRLRRRLPRATALVVQAHSDPSTMGRAPLLRAAARMFRGAVDAFLFTADAHGQYWRAAGFAASPQRMYQVMEASTGFRPMPRATARADSGSSASTHASRCSRESA